MPGIYTHNVVFRKTVHAAVSKVKSDHLYRSIQSFFQTENHMKAGLFGAMGPDIFDYMKYVTSNKTFGSSLTFYLHDNAYGSFINDMVHVLYENGDMRSEWASEQKAYLMGYVSHIIADSFLNPYIFYSSGFPEGGENKSNSFYREKNLMFQYNIDNYYIYRDEETSGWNMKIEDMLFTPADKKNKGLERSVKVFILRSLKRNNPEMVKEFFKIGEDEKIDGDTGKVPGLDKIPERIKLAFKIKRSTDTRSSKIASKVKESKLLDSEFLLKYPPAKRVDIDAINLHKAKWLYPCADKKIRYESVPQLLNSAVEKILEAWIEIESILYGNENVDLTPFLKRNPYTGLEGYGFNDMDTKDPVKLRF